MGLMGREIGPTGTVGFIATQFLTYLLPCDYILRSLKKLQAMAR